MSGVREAWTDERLDDLSARVDHGFDRVDGEIRDLRSEMNARFDAMQRTMIIGFASLAASVVGAAIATGGAILATQL
jgi:hypothetical protein